MDVSVAVAEELRKKLPNFVQHIPEYTVKEIEEGTQSVGSEDFFFENGFLLSPASFERPLQPELKCQDGASQAFLDLIRDRLRDLRRISRTTRDSSSTLQSQLREIFAATSLLRQTSGMVGELPRRIAEARLLTHSLYTPRSTKSTLRECQLLVTSAPHCAICRLQCAKTLVDLRMENQAVLQIWHALLVCQERRLLSPEAIQERAVQLVSKCAQRIGLFWIRLDVVRNLAIDNRSEVDCATIDFLHSSELDWGHLSSSQKKKHHEFLSSVHLDSALGRTPSINSICNELVVHGAHGPTKMMHNFSILVPKLLWVSAAPQTRPQIECIAVLGIESVISVSEEVHLERDWFSSLHRPMKYIRFGVQDSSLPCFNDVDLFMVEAIFTAALRVTTLLFCKDGISQSSSLAAVWLMCFGMEAEIPSFCNECMQYYQSGNRIDGRFGSCPFEECSLSLHTLSLSPLEAARAMTMLRPCSNASDELVNFLDRYRRLLLGRRPNSTHLTSGSAPGSERVAMNESYSKRLGIMKYPRTRHFLNLGGSGVSQDDIVATSRDVRVFCGLFNKELNVASSMNGSRSSSQASVYTIEEKLDGANVAFSLSNRGEVLAQNRSHFVDEASHAQFKSLRRYINENDESLRTVLSCGRYILYGEWLFARHSIHYTDLPSYFIAFDLFDKLNGSFLSRSLFKELLSDTGISTVPELRIQTPLSPQDLTTIACETKSKFYDGPIEGCVIRRDVGNFCMDRLKIVRPDFIQGNEHWSRGPLERNRCVDTF